MTVSSGLTVTSGNLAVSAGTLSVAGASGATAVASIAGGISGSTVYGQSVTPTISSATTSGQAIAAQVLTANSLSSPFIASVRALPPSFGTSQSITNFYQFYSDPVAIPAGITNAFAAFFNAPTGASGLNEAVHAIGTSNFGRIRASTGSAVVNGDIVLSSGWGSTATVSVTAGSTDQRGTALITAGGSGITANPLATLTFHDGAWPATPFARVDLIGGTGVSSTAQSINTSPSTTTLQWQAFFTPVSGNTYLYTWSLLG